MFSEVTLLYHRLTFKIAINQVTDSTFIRYINIPKLGVVVKVRCQNYFNRLE